MTGESPKEEDRQLKMKDLQLIFSAFEEELVQRALQSEDALTVLANYMATQDYHKIKFLVSGFARINAQEYQFFAKNDGKRTSSGRFAIGLSLQI